MQLTLQNGFTGAALKVERAYSHINEFDRTVRQLSGIPANALTITKQADGSETAQFTSLGEAGRLMPLIIGDAIHNLRSAFDHLWLALHRTTSDTGKPSFPFHKTRQNLVDALTKSPVKSAFPNVEPLILNEIKPHRDSGGNEAVWAITHFDNIDKHNLIIPVVQVHKATIRIGGVKFTNCSFSGNAVDFASNAPLEIKDDGHITIEIALPEGDALGGQPVLPTLLNMAQATSKAVQLFREEFL